MPLVLLLVLSPSSSYLEFDHVDLFSRIPEKKKQTEPFFRFCCEKESHTTPEKLKKESFQSENPSNVLREPYAQGI